MYTPIPVREGWVLQPTSMACPEQYDLLDHKGDEKAHLHLRNGRFKVWIGMQDIFEHTFPDDPYKGMFETEEERQFFLGKAVDLAEFWWRSIS